jgi:O-antigen/teichoic acid export membrane protein
MMVSTNERIATFSPRRVLRGLASSILGQILSLLQAFLLVPLYFRAWGADGYGRWLAISAAVGHLALLDFGGQAFIGNSLAYAFAQGKEDEFRRKLELGLFLYFSVAGIAFAALSAFLLCWPSAHFSSGDKLVSALLGAAYLLTVPGGILASCYRATGQIVRGNWIGNVFRGISLVAFAIALAMKIGVVLYSVIFLLLWLGNLIGVFWDLRRRILNLKLGRLSLRNAKASITLLGGSFNFWLISVAQTLNNQGFLLLLAVLLGDQAVVLYSTHKTASGIIGYSTSLFQPSIWSELSFLAARHEVQRAAKFTLLSIRVSVLFAGALAIILWFAGPLVYSVWTHHSLQVQPTLLALLVLQGVLAAGWSTASWPLLAANRHNEVAKWSLLNSLLTVFGAWLAIALQWGIEGAVLASILSDLICGLWAFPALASRYLQLPSAKFYLAMLHPAMGLIPAALLAHLSFQLATTNWVRLAYLGLAALLSVLPAMRLSLGKHSLIHIQSIWRTANEESSR